MEREGAFCTQEASFNKRNKLFRRWVCDSLMVSSLFCGFFDGNYLKLPEKIKCEAF